MSALTAIPVKVVDASALAALLFGEPGAEAVAGRLADARLVSPALLGFELAKRLPGQDTPAPRSKPLN